MFEAQREIIRVEQMCARETKRLLLSNPAKYGGLLLKLHCAWLAPDISPSDARTGKAAYLFMRHIDDALDGDHKEYPKQGANPDALPMTIEQIRAHTSPSSIAVLGRHMLQGFERKQQAGDDTNADIQLLLDSMRDDHKRMREGAMFMSEADRVAHFNRAEKGTNLQLIGWNGPIRSTDIPDFAMGVSRVQSATDFEQDWTRGIKNIPALAANGEAIYWTDMPLDELVRDDGFKNWQTAELDTAERELQATLDVFSEVRPATVITVLSSWAESVQKRDIPAVREHFDEWAA